MKIRELRERAEKATPGPWYEAEVTGDGRTEIDDGRSSWSNYIACETPDARYISAIDPTTLLALLGDFEKCRAALARLTRFQPSIRDMAESESLLAAIDERWGKP